MTLKLFNRAVTALPLLGMIALSAACSSSSNAAGSNGSAGAGALSGSGGAATAVGAGGDAGTPTCPDYMGLPVIGPGPGSGCADGVCFGCITPIEGMGFANGVVSITDDSGVTTAVLRTEPGRVCMSGVSVGFAILSLPLAGFHIGLDAAALGITQVEFTVETPPSTGVVPQFSSHFEGFDLMSAGQRVSIGGPSTQRASLSDFENPDLMLDQSQLIAFGLAASSAEHYDFCIRDLKFLDADGVEVLPTP